MVGRNLIHFKGSCACLAINFGLQASLSIWGSIVKDSKERYMVIWTTQFLVGLNLNIILTKSIRLGQIFMGTGGLIFLSVFCGRK